MGPNTHETKIRRSANMGFPLGYLDQDPSHGDRQHQLWEQHVSPAAHDAPSEAMPSHGIPRGPMSSRNA